MTSNNIVNFLEWKQKKKEQQDEYLVDDYEDLHEICTMTANDLLYELEYDYDINVQKIEFAAEMIFFFEAYKALIMKSADQWHPFQEIAEDFMREQNIVVEHAPGGGYHFIIKGEEDDAPPANDEE